MHKTIKYKMLTTFHYQINDYDVCFIMDHTSKMSYNSFSCYRKKIDNVNYLLYYCGSIKSDMSDIELYKYFKQYYNNVLNYQEL